VPSHALSLEFMRTIPAKPRSPHDPAALAGAGRGLLHLAVADLHFDFLWKAFIGRPRTCGRPRPRRSSLLGSFPSSLSAFPSPLSLPRSSSNPSPSPFMLLSRIPPHAPPSAPSPVAAATYPNLRHDNAYVARPLSVSHGRVVRPCSTVRIRFRY